MVTGLHVAAQTSDAKLLLPRSTRDVTTSCVMTRRTDQLTGFCCLLCRVLPLYLRCCCFSNCLLRHRSMTGDPDLDLVPRFALYAEMRR